jgi:hypothetical protein
MKITRHHIAAAVTVLALGVLAAAALASGRSEALQPQPTAQAAAATPEVRTEVVREPVQRSREDRREDRAATTTAAPAAARVASRTSGRDASGHGGRGRDHAEDDGTVEVEHENEVEDHGGRHGGGEVEDHGGNSGHGGGGHGGDDD